MTPKICGSRHWYNASDSCEPEGWTTEQHDEDRPTHVSSTAVMKLAANLALVEAEIERKKQLCAYDACLAETNTTSITRKSTELTKEMVTDALRASFKSELSQIGFRHTAIEVVDVGGSKGVLRHQIVFPHAPGVHVGKVLSEGSGTIPRGFPDRAVDRTD